MALETAAARNVVVTGLRVSVSDVEGVNQVVAVGVFYVLLLACWHTVGACHDTGSVNQTGVAVYNHRTGVDAVVKDIGTIVERGAGLEPTCNTAGILRSSNGTVVHSPLDRSDTVEDACNTADITSTGNSTVVHAVGNVVAKSKSDDTAGMVVSRSNSTVVDTTGDRRNGVIVRGADDTGSTLISRVDFAVVRAVGNVEDDLRLDGRGSRADNGSPFLPLRLSHCEALESS